MFQTAPAAFRLPKLVSHRSPTQEDRLTVPGYNLPLHYLPEQNNLYGSTTSSLFPTALYDRHLEKGWAAYVTETLWRLVYNKAL